MKDNTTIWQIFKLMLMKFSCHHKWYKYDELKIYGDDRSDNLPIYIQHTLICKECGKIKKMKL
jgi:hypothetical protein